MKKKEALIILLCIVAFIILIFLNAQNYNSNEEIPQYIIIDNKIYWKYQYKDWANLDMTLNKEEVSNEINWQDYKIYVNNEYVNTLKYVFMNGKSYFFNDSNDEVDISSNNILFNKDTYLKLSEYNNAVLTNNDYNIINDILSKENRDSNNLTTIKKYNIKDNFDIYILSNYSEENIINNTAFNFIFYKINNINKILVDEDLSLENYNYNLSYLLNVSSKYDNIILSYTCEEETCYSMYQYNSDKTEYELVEMDTEITKETSTENGIISSTTISYFLLIIPLVLLVYIIFLILKKISDSKNKPPD
jgi:Ca2+/Na+ antiporter